MIYATWTSTFTPWNIAGKTFPGDGFGLFAVRTEVPLQY